MTVSGPIEPGVYVPRGLFGLRGRVIGRVVVQHQFHDRCGDGWVAEVVYTEGSCATVRAQVRTRFNGREQWQFAEVRL